MVQFHDRALIDGPARLTKEGHLVATARVARANNIQDYMPSEIGMAPKADGTPYRIFRPEAEVFAKDALSSAAHRPITIDHPKQDVSAENWKQLAVGDTGGEILRDGDFLRIPVMVMDSKGVQAARTTHQEFSLGYSADLDMTPGKFGDAEYDGSMRSIRVNHLALCGTARGGAELRIVDERPPHLQEKPMKIKIGDAEVDPTNGEAVSIAVQALDAKYSAMSQQFEALGKDFNDAKAKVATLETEKATLEKQVADATLTPEKLRDAAAAYAQVVGKAKALGVKVGDADSTETIMKAVVDAKMGDTAKGWTAEQIAASFAVLAKDAKVADANLLDRAISGQPQAVVTDSRTFYQDAQARRRAELSGAWKTQPKNEAA